MSGRYFRRVLVKRAWLVKDENQKNLVMLRTHAVGCVEMQVLIGISYGDTKAFIRKALSKWHKVVRLVRK